MPSSLRSMAMPTRRSHVIVKGAPDEVWGLIRDPLGWNPWFPEMGESSMEGDLRTITLPSGLAIVEQITTVDDELRRFQYRIVENFVIKDHLSTIDVFDLSDGTSLVSYSLEIQPDAMAIMLGYVTGQALLHLREIFEGK